MRVVQDIASPSEPNQVPMSISCRPVSALDESRDMDAQDLMKELEALRDQLSGP